METFLFEGISFELNDVFPEKFPCLKKIPDGYGILNSSIIFPVIYIYVSTMLTSSFVSPS
jgi:hypothetical protein